MTGVTVYPSHDRRPHAWSLQRLIVAPGRFYGFAGGLLDDIAAKQPVVQVVAVQRTVRRPHPRLAGSVFERGGLETQPVEPGGLGLVAGGVLADGRPLRAARTLPANPERHRRLLPGDWSIPPRIIHE